MDILNRNLKEGAGERTVRRVLPIDNIPIESSSVAGEETRSSDVIKRITNAASELPATVQVGTFLKFAFTLESLVISLFTKKDVGLATCGIYVLSVKGSILANTSINVSLILHDIQLDDIRVERKSTLTRYMGRKLNRNKDKESSMIDITCALQGNSTFADVRISGFDLIISVDFLMHLSAFAPAAAQKPVQGPKTVALTTQTQKQQPGVTNGEGYQMNVTITIEQPDIILMEKMDGKSSNALILNFEMRAKLRREGLHQTINGEIQNFNLHMCEFSMNRRDTEKYYIIRPVGISINGSTPEGGGLKVAVLISDINISISPLILELVNRIIAQTTDTSAGKQEDAVVDYANLWRSTPFVEEDHWYTQVETALDAASALKDGVVQVLNEICTLEMPSLVLKVETGYGNHTIPMLRLASKMQVNVRNWSSQIAIEGSLEMGVSYYNSNLALWEPLLEPNEVVTTSGLINKMPWILNLGVNIEDNIDDITNGELHNPNIKHMWINMISFPFDFQKCTR